MIDTLNRPVKNASLLQVKSDYVVETHHFRRVIRIKKKRIVLKTKKYDTLEGGKKRHEFYATDISIFWQANEPVEYIMVYGTSVSDSNLNCRRRFEPRKIPKEILEIIGEDIKCPQI